jgi:hypothetical protein
MFSIETNRGVSTPSLPPSVASKQGRSNAAPVSALLRNSHPNTSDEFTNQNNSNTTQPTHADWDTNDPAMEKTTKFRIQQQTPPTFINTTTNMDQPPPLTTVAIVKQKPIQTNKNNSSPAAGMSRTKSLFSMGTSLSTSPASSACTNNNSTNTKTTQHGQLSHLQQQYHNNNPHQDQDSHHANNNSVIFMISIETACTELTHNNPVPSALSLTVSLINTYSDR